MFVCQFEPHIVCEWYCKLCMQIQLVFGCVVYHSPQKCLSRFINVQLQRGLGLEFCVQQDGDIQLCLFMYGCVSSLSVYIL